jgi:hypothetical protein
MKTREQIIESMCITWKPKEMPAGCSWGEVK